MEKIKIALPIIVEGRYDKSTLSGFIDARIITTGGFSIFNNKEKQALIRRMGEGGIILLTDSDGGGKQIRKFISGIIPPDKVHNLYIPKIAGKESRKRKASAGGTLGVEGMDKEVLLRLLEPFKAGNEQMSEGRQITKTDFFLDGLSGSESASERRRLVCKRCDLPDDMTANALLEAMNMLYGYERYKEIIAELSAEKTD